MASVIQDFKMDILQRREISKLSLNNQFQVSIGSLPSGVQSYLNVIGVNWRWIAENAGLMCNEATLPTSSFATAEVKDNYHGINQQFAHNRIYVESDFTFYIDQNYNMIKIFEGWMDYISGDDINGDPASPTFFRRFNYPNGNGGTGGYKASTMSITKFEKNDNYGRRPSLTYVFHNMFPKSIISIPVAYGAADLTRVTVTFQYDRYYIENTPATSIKSNGETQSSRYGINPLDNVFGIASLKNSTDRNKRLSDLRRKTETRRNSTGSQVVGSIASGLVNRSFRKGLFKNETVAQFKAATQGGSTGKDK